MANEMYCDNFIMSEDGEKFEMTQTSKGDPGFSPIANVTQEGDVTTITITDEKGTTTAEIDISGKVDKVEGKGLSTNDYTNEEKKKVADAALQTDLTALARQVSGKQNAPATAGTAGQVLSLNDQLQPVWMDQTSGEDVAPVIINTASGAIASFDDGADSMPIKSLVAQIEPVQDLHGYDHPWPAGGMGNLLPMAKAEYVASDGGLTFAFTTDGHITINGTSNKNVYVQVPFEEPLPAGEYTACLFNQVGNSDVQFSVRKADMSSDGLWFIPNAINKSYTETISSDAYYWQIQIASGKSFNNFGFAPMLVAGSTAPTTYYPYSNICPISGWTGVDIFHEAEYDADADPAISVNWEDEAGTVYGGKATFNNDESVDLDVSWESVVLKNLSASGFWIGTKSVCQRWYLNDYAIEAANAGVYIGAKSSMEEEYPAYFGAPRVNEADHNVFAISLDGDIVAVYDPDLTLTEETMAAKFAEMQVVYPLATPRTYHFDNIGQLQTFLGTNNIWSNTGNTEVNYTADTKLYIDGKLAELQATILENIGG